MDRYLNTPGYPTTLIKKYPSICAYNSFKAKYVPKIDPVKMYSHKNALVNERKIPAFLQYSDLFQDEDGTMKPLPYHVVDEISEAICSINIHPSQIKMWVEAGAGGEMYQLYVKYTNAGIADEQPATTVELKYRFNKNLSKLSGYFGKHLLYKPTGAIRIDDELPNYERTAVTQKRLDLEVTYQDDCDKDGKRPPSTSTLYVMVEVASDMNYVYKNLTPGVYFPETQDYGLHPATTLLSAVYRRVFPTDAHLSQYFLNQVVKREKAKFSQTMNLVPLNWLRQKKDPQIQKYVRYLLRHTSGNKSPFLSTSSSFKELTEQDYRRAMAHLIDKEPFFAVDDQAASYGPPNECVLDLWERCFQKKLTLALAREMEPSEVAKTDLLKYYLGNPM